MRIDVSVKITKSTSEDGYDVSIFYGDDNHPALCLTEASEVVCSSAAYLCRKAFTGTDEDFALLLYDYKAKLFVAEASIYNTTVAYYGLDDADEETVLTGIEVLLTGIFNADINGKLTVIVGSEELCSWRSKTFQSTRESFIETLHKLQAIGHKMKDL